jgi:hypothetical protein
MIATPRARWHAAPVERDRQAPGHGGQRRVGDLAQAAARRIRLVDDRHPIAVHQGRALQEIDQRQRDVHGRERTRPPRRIAAP